MLDERPTAAELIAAVADFLEKKATPQLDAHTAFHAKVAVNALRIVERELVQGAAVVASELDRLTTLTHSAGDVTTLNAALCSMIADGKISADDPALREHLARSVLARIAIDNPKYPSLKVAAARWPALAPTL